MSDRPAGGGRGRVGILISGRGSNMVALVEAMRAGRVDAEPAVVISNRPKAEGLARAAELGVPTAAVSHRAVRPRERHEAEIADLLDAHRVDLVCLAGYMRLLSPYLVGRFRNRMLNIHPSLLPAFPGLDAQQQALDHGVKVAGCTVHVVDEGCDQGPILLQAAVPVLEGDTAETLSARILVQEHRIYAEAVALWFAGRVRIVGRRVQILDAAVR